MPKVCFNFPKTKSLLPLAVAPDYTDQKIKRPVEFCNAGCDIFLAKPNGRVYPMVGTLIL